MTATHLDLIRGDQFTDRFGRTHEVLSVSDTRPGRAAVFCTDGLLLHEDITWLATLEEAP